MLKWIKNNLIKIISRNCEKQLRDIIIGREQFDIQFFIDKVIDERIEIIINDRILLDVKINDRIAALEKSFYKLNKYMIADRDKLDDFRTSILLEFDKKISDAKNKG